MQYSLRALLSYVEAVAGAMVSALPEAAFAERGCRTKATLYFFFVRLTTV